MSATDLERADTLDALTSDELEALAFGPEPRRLRGLVRRPAAAPARTPGAGRRRGRGGRLVAVAVVAGLVGAGVAVAVSDAHDHDDVLHTEYEEDGVVYYDEVVEDGHTYGEVLTEDGEVLDITEDELWVEGDEFEVEDL